nr:hypothetical protein GCM10020092_029470 [Actinoplanes digitatis]
MIRVLEDAGLRRGPAVTVLGGGGTARAALAAAAGFGATEVTVVTRRPEARDELAPAAAALGVTIVGRDWSRAASAFDADAVISTVPKGAADELATAVRFSPGAVLFDAIYDPWPTPLAAAAQRQGVRVVSGLDLLLAQALGQFEQFTGVVLGAGERHARGADRGRRQQVSRLRRLSDRSVRRDGGHLKASGAATVPDCDSCCVG